MHLRKGGLKLKVYGARALQNQNIPQQRNKRGPNIERQNSSNIPFRKWGPQSLRLRARTPYLLNKAHSQNKGAQMGAPGKSTKYRGDPNQESENGGPQSLRPTSP